MTGSPSSTTRTPEVSNERRHKQGLAVITAALQEKDPYRAVFELGDHPAVEPALRDAALVVADVPSSTTVLLEMSEADACTILHALCGNFDQLWGDLGGDGLPIEDDLSFVHDYTRAITSMSNALASPAAKMARAQRDRRARLPRTIKPEIVSRLEDLRTEFADDPDAIEFLIDMAGVFTERPKPADAAPAEGAKTAQ